MLTPLSGRDFTPRLSGESEEGDMGVSASGDPFETLRGAGFAAATVAVFCTVSESGRIRGTTGVSLRGTCDPLFAAVMAVDVPFLDRALPGRLTGRRGGGITDTEAKLF